MAELPVPRPRAPADFEALYERAACGLLVTSADGLIRRVNATFCEWVGRTAPELVDKVKLQELLTMGGRIFHQTHWAPLLQIQGSVSEVKLDIVHSGGRKLPVMLNALRREVSGEVRHELAVFIAEDRHQWERELILARRRAEDLLEKERAAQQALGIARDERDRQQVVAQDRALFAEQMMAIVSHDLRNPLSVIRLSAHLLGMGELSPDQRRALARLSSATARATRLISDLLDFSQARIGTGLQVELKPVELHALVAEAVEDLRLSAGDRSLVHKAFGEGACLAGADRLVQLIGNLVTNALAYGAADEPVVITSRIAADTFGIAVHNRGPAIPAEQLPTLFDPMTRGTGGIDQSTHSVGLGLFIVREICRAHRADVWVHSSVADGTTFEASFPRGCGAAASAGGGRVDCPVGWTPSA